MEEILKKHIPEPAISKVIKLLQDDKLRVIIKNERKTKHGDYRPLPNGLHQITVNASLNKYRFLITLIHEIAHFEAFEKFGRYIKPHGKEWKYTFQKLMIPFINPDIFPHELLPLIANHFRNPKASSDTDVHLSRALKSFDSDYKDKTYVFQLDEGTMFKLYNGRVFKKGERLRKRYQCTEVASGGLYLFNPNAEVEVIPAKAGISKTHK